MHNFLDVLLKLFVRVGDSLCVDKSDEVEIQGQLDFLCMSIFKLGQDVADASPLLWRRTLKLMQSQLQKRLRDFVQGAFPSFPLPSFLSFPFLSIHFHSFPSLSILTLKRRKMITEYHVVTNIPYFCGSLDALL